MTNAVNKENGDDVYQAVFNQEALDGEGVLVSNRCDDTESNDREMIDSCDDGCKCVIDIRPSDKEEKLDQGVDIGLPPPDIGLPPPGPPWSVNMVHVLHFPRAISQVKQEPDVTETTAREQWEFPELNSID